MMYRITLAIFLCILSGCSTAITYTKWNGTDQLESTALKFQLQDSSLTLAVPSKDESSPVAPGKQICPAGVTHADWWKCFNQVAPHAAMAPSTSDNIYVATPADASHLYFSTTTISGTTWPGQDTLYSQVTINYKNNTSKIIAGAATGAVTGFGIAGPYGAAAGLVIGAGSAGIPDRKAPGMLAIDLLPPPKLEDYICHNEPVNLSNLQATTLKPSLYLPLTINAAKARPLAQKQELVLPAEMSSACWHTLPNTSHLGDVSPHLAGATDTTPKLRDPIKGDGWLYRLVDADADVDAPTKPPKGAMLTKEYFSAPNANARQDFPYSACRNVILQVTWWKDLADAIKKTDGHPLPASPMVLTFKTVVADPDYVYTAKVKKGGVINFKANCGANVSLTADTSNAATINAIITATQNIYEAQQAWEKSQKK